MYSAAWIVVVFSVTSLLDLVCALYPCCSHFCSYVCWFMLLFGAMLCTFCVHLFLPYSALLLTFCFVFFLPCCCCCLLLNYLTERELLNQHSHPHLESLTREERNCKMNSIYIPRRQSLFLRHSVWEAKTWCRSKLHRHAHNYYFPTL